MSVKSKIAIYFAFQFMVLICSANFDRSERNQINASTNQTIPLITGTLQSMKRAITTSQVLTFNLKNFFILVILKAIVIFAGIVGKISFWKYPGVRSFSSSFPFANTESQIYDSIYSDEDMRWSSTFIWAINKNDFGCLFRLACENRKSAQIYLNAGRIFNRTAKSLFSTLMLSYNRSYEDILVGLQEALDTQEDQCRNKYTCRAPFDKLKFISFLQRFG